MSASSGGNPRRVRDLRQVKWPIVGLLLISFFLLLFRLGSSGLHDWDEGIYAQVSKEILQTGDWQTLHWMGRSWYEKPPLFLWITAAAYKVGGVSEWTARLPSALAARGFFFFLSVFWQHLRGQSVDRCICNSDSINGSGIHVPQPLWNIGCPAHLSDFCFLVWISAVSGWQSSRLAAGRIEFWFGRYG